MPQIISPKRNSHITSSPPRRHFIKNLSKRSQKIKKKNLRAYKQNSSISSINHDIQIEPSSTSSKNSPLFVGVSQTTTSNCTPLFIGISHITRNDSSQNLEEESENEDNTFDDDIYDNDFEQHNYDEDGEDNNDETNVDDGDNDYYDSEQENEQDNTSLFVQFTEEMGLRHYLQKNTGGSLSKPVTTSTINCFNKLLVWYIRSLANNTAADNTTPIETNIPFLASGANYAKYHDLMDTINNMLFDIEKVMVEFLDQVLDIEQRLRPKSQLSYLTAFSHVGKY